MGSNRHGLSVGLERVDNDYFLTLKAIGKLKHEDYERLNPMIDSFIEKLDQTKIRVLFDATAFEGWEARAAWDDFQLGLKYGKQFEKIAMYGNKMWQEAAAKVGTWFISGEMKYFENYDDALDWLRQ